ncbi:hypothetical protein MRS44_012183 [Fusarium solani]|uniref:Uncharacterized protein n=1 Tax=Fusarium solani TaxID=169388 RepID=A0A9P9KMY3_FUSSL|nr:uncharacterized protein B0J15DRAFT_547258 [Fusarium solani]KAH7264495.1 hypothetical protein B0J15DRAFT_547258 [Fusarium solani]KAJ3458074.1 hypothetical protein MRS44_012183 [Fusarium solani]KAJ4233128.1 hypothetical protein NW759_001910 [Fusarium solani]
MTLVRMLRPGLRPFAAPLLRPAQFRFAGTIHPEGSLGGPGGQQAPPPNPGGPEALKRNWVPIAGAVGVVLGGLYLLSPAKPKVERTFEGDMRAANSTEIGSIPQPSGRPSLAAKYKDKEVESLTELSGRKGGGGMGGFRAE